MSFRRGFKTSCERLAAEVRAEAGIGLAERFEPAVYAALVDIPIVALSDLRTGAYGARLAPLVGAERDAFSAMTIYLGTMRIIVHNDSHATTRKASNLAHELSHCLLEHAPAPLAGLGGCRHWNGELEDEANWLGGCLLVPREGALKLAGNGHSTQQIAEIFGVSESLCNWRINQTGIAMQLNRFAAFGVKRPVAAASLSGGQRSGGQYRARR